MKAVSRSEFINRTHCYTGVVGTMQLYLKGYTGVVGTMQSHLKGYTGVVGTMQSHLKGYTGVVGTMQSHLKGYTGVVGAKVFFFFGLSISFPGPRLLYATRPALA